MDSGCSGEVSQVFSARGCMMQADYEYLRDFSDADVEYFRQMPFSLSIPSHGVLVVHAGVVPGIPLEEQQLYDLITVGPFMFHSVRIPVQHSWICKPGASVSMLINLLLSQSIRSPL